MSKSAMVASGVVLFVVGGAIALFLQAQHIIDFFARFQVPGDPPVLVGDGSLHGHSKKGWLTDADGDMMIVPVTDTANGVGSFRNDSDCKVNGTSASAFLWTDDDSLYDISPSSSSGAGWKVSILHDHRNDSTDKHMGATVTIQVVNSQLQITTDKGSFDASKKNNDHDGHNREHNWPDVVTSITVQGASTSSSNSLKSGVWDATAKSGRHPHYTLAFCYH